MEAGIARFQAVSGKPEEIKETATRPGQTDRTGRGQEKQLGSMGSALAVLICAWSAYLHTGPRHGRCLLASAALKLASTANPSALTRPSALGDVTLHHALEKRTSSDQGANSDEPARLKRGEGSPQGRGQGVVVGPNAGRKAAPVVAIALAKQDGPFDLGDAQQGRRLSRISAGAGLIGRQLPLVRRR